jgi:hypothetical protein
MTKELSHHLPDLMQHEALADDHHLHPRLTLNVLQLGGEAQDVPQRRAVCGRTANLML